MTTRDVKGRVMKIAKIAGCIAAAAFLITAPLSVASAADMPLKAPKPVVPVFDWNGFYIGAYAGAAFMDQATTSDPCRPGVGVACSIGVTNTGNYNLLP